MHWHIQDTTAQPKWYSLRMYMLIVPTFKSTPFMFQAQHISSHHEPFMYQGLPIHMLSCLFHTNPFNTISCKTHVNPLYIIHNLHYSIILTHTKPLAQILKTKPTLSIQNQENIPHYTVSPSTSLRLEGLAQASLPLA